MCIYVYDEESLRNDSLEWIGLDCFLLKVEDLNLIGTIIALNECMFK